MKKLSVIMLALLLVVVGACNHKSLSDLTPETNSAENSGTTTPGVETSAPEIQVGATNVLFGAEASSQSVAYTINNPSSEGSLTVSVPTADFTWLQATVSESDVTFTVEAIGEEDSRTTTVTLSYPGADDVLVTVSQTATFAIAPVLDTLYVPVEGGNMSISYTVVNTATKAASNAAATTDNTVDWISNISTDDSNVYFTVDASKLTEARTATFTLTLDEAEDATFTVVQSGISVGDYFCASSSSDWYVMSKGSNVTQTDVLGIVFSIDASRVGTVGNLSDPKGLVISKKNATDEATYWYTYGSAWQVTGSTVTTVAALYSDVNGYQKTQAVWSSSLYNSDSSRFPGFVAVQECNNGTNANVPVAPSNTSGWFVPSSGQMWDFMENVAGWDMSSYRNSTASASTEGLAFSVSSFNALSTCLDGLYDVDSFVTAGLTYNYYATSTEISNSQAATASWNSNNYSVSLYGKQMLGEVEFRPVLAF